ncbi:hypothetical protein AX17_007142 [Amanita inopinata Kibby_2008]|nr:hypothetical protein AX17_007142 [Amanita inopinata Kibby_2008]
MVQFTTASSIAVLNLALMAATASAIPVQSVSNELDARTYTSKGEKVFMKGISSAKSIYDKIEGSDHRPQHRASTWAPDSYKKVEQDERIKKKEELEKKAKLHKAKFREPSPPNFDRHSHFKAPEDRKNKKFSEEDLKKMHETMMRKSRRGVEFDYFEKRDMGGFGLEERELGDIDLETRDFWELDELD